MARNSLLAIGAGAALMYYLDPDRGRRRRALVRDKLFSTLRCSRAFLDKAFRDIGNRAHGGFAAGVHLVRREPAANDDVLAARVRSRLGRLVSHPSAIEIQVRDGSVTLTGPILRNELERALTGVACVSGVRNVENHLEVHTTSEGVPGLQGSGSPRKGDVPELFQDRWTPALRLAGMAGGAALVGYGVRRADALGALMGVAGGAAFTRALSNCDFAHLVGAGDGRAIAVQKTINISAPVEQVFDLWRRFDQFPRFMAHVREIRPLGNNRWRWSVTGPAGAPVKWDCEITRLEDNRVLAWKSIPGSLVQNSGIIVFRPNSRGGTQVDVRISYRPPLGEIGHAALSVAGADPRSMMHLDLVQLKSILEQGKTRKHGETVTQSTMMSSNVPPPASSQTSGAAIGQA